jgi:uncharacterized membrane protein
MNRATDTAAEGAARRLETVVGGVLRAGVMLSSVCLAIGLLLSLSGSAASAAALVLQIGILVLLATPVARVLVSTVQYISERDWPFASLTLIVLVELLASVVAALIFNKKL